jgi:hypothetical protein
MLNLSFNPFISKQLYKRKVFSKNPEYYRIKNSTSFKFLICYDKKYSKEIILTLKIQEIETALQSETKKLLNVVPVLKTAIQELNGVEINEHYQLQVELIKKTSNILL